jgi:hypothetical protein
VEGIKAVMEGTAAATMDAVAAVIAASCNCTRNGTAE